MMRVEVKPELLRWARERSMIEPAALAERFPRLDAWTQSGARCLMAYLLDANVFIAAKNLHYGLDFCPAFWDWLVEKQAEGIVFSVEKVRDEVLAVADDLADRIDQRYPSFFLTVDATSFPSLAAVSEWTTGNRYDQAPATTFLQIAGYYLVAQALAGQHTVVTHEVPSAHAKDQDSRCLHRSRHQFHDALSDAATGTRAFHSWTGCMKPSWVGTGWRQLEEATCPWLKDLLLAAAPRAEVPVTPRRARRRREPPAFE